MNWEVVGLMEQPPWQAGTAASAAGSACAYSREARLGAELVAAMRRDKHDVLRALRGADNPAELLDGYYGRVDGALARLRQLRSEHARRAAGLAGGAYGIAPERLELPWNEAFLQELERELQIPQRWGAGTARPGQA